MASFTCISSTRIIKWRAITNAMTHLRISDTCGARRGIVGVYTVTEVKSTLVACCLIKVQWSVCYAQCGFRFCLMDTQVISLVLR